MLINYLHTRAVGGQFFSLCLIPFAYKPIFSLCAPPSLGRFSLSPYCKAGRVTRKMLRCSLTGPALPSGLCLLPPGCPTENSL